MNEMWSEMSHGAREEYKEYFIRYHNTVAKTGFTGKRVKPLTVLPPSVVNGFEKAILTKVPEDNYLLLPNLLSQLKMWALSWLPIRVAQHIIGKQYRKSWANFSSSASDCGSVASYYSPSINSRPPSQAASSPSTSVRSFASGSTNYSSMKFWKRESKTMCQVHVMCNFSVKKQQFYKVRAWVLNGEDAFSLLPYIPDNFPLQRLIIAQNSINAQNAINNCQGMLCVINV